MAFILRYLAKFGSFGSQLRHTVEVIDNTSATKKCSLKNSMVVFSKATEKELLKFRVVTIGLCRV